MLEVANLILMGLCSGFSGAGNTLTQHTIYMVGVMVKMRCPYVRMLEDAMLIALLFGFIRMVVS